MLPPNEDVCTTVTKEAFDRAGYRPGVTIFRITYNEVRDQKTTKYARYKGFSDSSLIVSLGSYTRHIKPADVFSLKEISLEETLELLNSIRE